MDMIDALREEEQPGTPIGGVEKNEVHSAHSQPLPTVSILCTV
jgi:hypothetical protein